MVDRSRSPRIGCSMSFGHSFGGLYNRCFSPSLEGSCVEMFVQCTRFFDTENQTGVRLICALGIAGSLQSSRSAPAFGSREVSLDGVDSPNVHK